MRRYTFPEKAIEAVKDGFKVTAVQWTRGTGTGPKGSPVMVLPGVKLTELAKATLPTITFGIVANRAFVNGKMVGDLRPNTTNTALIAGPEGAETVKVTARKGNYLVSVNEEVLTGK